MKLLYLSLIIISSLFIGCKEDAVQPDPEIINDFFPSTSGTYYKYNITYTDSNGTNNSGSRTATYSGSQTFNGIEYQTQIDSLFIADSISVSSSFFRRTEGGVYYYIDTTGLFENIPAEFATAITTDNEVQFLSLPLDKANNWTAFTMNFNFSSNAFPIISVKGFNEGTENITLPLTTGSKNVNALRIKYDLTLNLPNPENPLQFTTSNYEMFGWFAEGIGAVRLSGDAIILNVFSGGSFSLEDTTTTVTQVLVEYNLK